MTEAELLQLDDLQFVERAYPFVLGRPADPMGLRDYLARVRAGTPKTQILAELRNSEEARRHARALAAASSSAGATHSGVPARRGATSLADLMRLTDGAFVEQAYRLTLGRPADPTGRASYVSELSKGAGRLDVLNGLLLSQEGLLFNAALPEIREAIERRRMHRLPFVRQALRACRILRARMGRNGRGNGSPRSRPARPPSMPSEGTDPMRPRDAAPPPRKPSMDMSNTELPAHRAGPSPRLSAAAEEVEALAIKPDDTPAPALASNPGDWTLGIERFVGPTLHGVSSIDGRAAAFAVEFGGRSLGRVSAPQAGDDPTIAMPDDADSGFSVLLGGLLQFAAMAPSCRTAKLAHLHAAGGARSLDLQAYLAEALTFSPMRALMRPLLGKKAGNIRSMRMISPTEASIVFEADAGPAEGGTLVFLDLYQEEAPGKLLRLGRFAVELSAQIVDLEFRLVDADAPLLMVVTDNLRGIIATDCFPLPSLCSEANAPLVEYHVVLESGKPPFATIAKIARSFLDRAIRQRASGGAGESATAGIAREQTCLILTAQDNADPNVGNLLGARRALAGEVVFLDALGQVMRSSGESVALTDFVRGSPARHFLFADNQVQLRPDFWSVIDDNAHRLSGEAALTHWHSIWIDGMSRPQLVKTGLLLHPAFARHRLLEARALIADRATLQSALERDAASFASGRLVLEKAFAFVENDRTALIPVVMHTVQTSIAPLIVQRYQAEQQALETQPPALKASTEIGLGVSIVINYRDGVEDTLRCLASIGTQRREGPLEIVLVNNGSTTASVEEIAGAARELFGSDNVRAIDYPHRFNHSTQCNIAALAARHDMLLMLSNDSVLRSPTAITRSARIAAIPWVGTCGYRIVGNEANKKRLQSLGLGLNERRYLFSGGSPVATSMPPAFALDCTFEVIGNTFAAVMLRREVYRALDGLDSIAFPTNYNDIDFSFRAVNAGYRHVVIGSEVVEHVGRGSREADQDLPIDQRIVERAPRLEVLARIGFQQL